MQSPCSALTLAEAVVGLRSLSETKLQRIEKGRATFRYVADLRKLAEGYGASIDVVEELVDLHKDASSQDWLTQFRSSLNAPMQAFAGIEGEACGLRMYHPVLVPGILQTEAYARGLFEEVRTIDGRTTSYIDAHVKLRTRRKEESILRPDDPVRAWVVIRESALLRPVGEIEVMHGQYDEIARLATLENIRIQVLPMKAWTIQFPYDFTLLDLGHTLPATVQTDTAWGALSMSDKASEITRFVEIFQAMTASALPPEHTPAIMKRLAREIEQ
ncbi:helix-turn-helix domain-containing protein [Streptomyces sp. NPDC057910]|uniref:helix-turn-helix domain-containing protein n=1 Tax=Streptomyces sp. NPDC057910 TaxID=3346278 RepID=UPI0036E234A0